MKKYRFILCIPFIVMAGCSGGEDQAMKEQADKERILDGQMQALEKAKGVEEVVQRGDYAHREIIEEQSR